MAKVAKGDWSTMTQNQKATAKTQKPALAYHSFFAGPKAEGFNVPCIPVDGSNVLRALVLAITPETVKRETVVELIHSGDHKALKAADVVLKARLQRWFKGSEPNTNDPDGLIPSVGANGNVVDIPLSLLGPTAEMIAALAKSDLATKGAKLQEAIRAEAEASKRRCGACNHVARSGQKFCSECGTKLPEEAPKEEAKPTGWTCTCGHKDNTGKFCMECGAKRPDTSGTTGKITEVEKAAPSTQEDKPTKKGGKKGEGAPPLEDLKSALASLPESVRKSLGASLLRN